MNSQKEKEKKLTDMRAKKADKDAREDKSHLTVD